MTGPEWSENPSAEFQQNHSSPRTVAQASSHEQGDPSEYDKSGRFNRNPPGMSLWQLLKEDLATHEGNLFDFGFQAVAVHRFGNWRMGLKLKILRAPCTLLYRIMYYMVEMMGGITLPYTCRLGRRVRIWHHSGIILSAYAIGDDVHIRQNTTFGVVRRNQNDDIPIIEDRVDLGCGVCVLGRVRIGHDSVIGANSVVLKDIPPCSVAVGQPARVVKTLPEEARS